MAYNAFDDNIFSSSAANTACNKILEKLQLQFTVEIVNTEFALTGCAARYFQYPTEDNVIRSISFVTSSSSIYSYLASNISSIINVSTAVAYVDRIQITIPEGIKIEVWKEDTPLDIVVVNNIVMHDRDTMHSKYWPFCLYGEYTGVETPLLLDSDQSFNGGGNILFQQGWSFSLGFIEANWTQGTALPENILIDTNIRNFSNVSSYDDFTDFELLLVSNRGSGNGLLADFFTTTINDSTEYELAGNSLKVETVVEFINFNVLDSGVYFSTLQFKVTGISSRTGTRVGVETVSVPIKLTVLGANDISVEPQLIQFQHVLAQDLPDPKEFVVNVAGIYTITCAKVLLIKGDGLTDESTRDYTVKRGTGKKTLLIGVGRSVEDAGVSNKSYSVTIASDNGTLSIKVNVSVLETGGILVEPMSFEFEAVKGVEEASRQGIEINSPLAYDISYDGWIGISRLSGALGSNFIGLVDPADSDNFAPGVYDGKIQLKTVEEVVIIPVVYTVKAESFSDLVSEQINFTKDQIFMNLATKNSNVYLRALLGLTWYSFSNIETTTEYPQHIPIFNGQAEFHPGDFIHNIMDSLVDLEQFIPEDLEATVELPFNYYLPASLDITMEQRRYSDDVIVSTQEINNLLFVKGTNPNQFADDAGIMLSDYPVRVTPNSYGILNFIKRSGVHNIEVHVNGVKKRSIPHDTQSDSLFGMIFSFAEYQPGDLVYLKISGAYDVFYERRFYVFPENKESYHIAWVTEHEQLEILEFTGGYSIETDYERVENSVYKNLVNVKEILQTDKTQPLVANTGWVLKDNHVLLDSLQRSKRAWLFLPNTDYKIALVPQSTKLSNYDSDQGTYAYEIEFTINPDNDAKVYPR